MRNSNNMKAPNATASKLTVDTSDKQHPAHRNTVSYIAQRAEELEMDMNFFQNEQKTTLGPSQNQQSRASGFMEQLRIPNHVQNTDPSSQRKAQEGNPNPYTASSNVSRSRTSKVGQQMKRKGSSNRAIDQANANGAQSLVNSRSQLNASGTVQVGQADNLSCSS